MKSIEQRRLRSSRPTRSFAFACSTLALAACGGGQRARLESPLPFHVALLPVETKLTDLSTVNAIPASAQTRVQKDNDKDKKDKPHLLLVAEDMTREISQVLRGRGFTEVSVLKLPEKSTTSQSLSETDRNAYWQAEAEKIHADLI